METIDWELAAWCYSLAVSTSLGVLCLSEKSRLSGRNVIGTLLLYGGTAAGVGIMLNEYWHQQQAGYSLGVSMLIGSRVISLSNLKQYAGRLLGTPSEKDRTDG